MPEQVADIQFEKAPVIVCQCRREVWADSLFERLQGPRVVLRAEGSGLILRGTCRECGAVYTVEAAGQAGITRAEAVAALEAIG